MKVIVCGGRDYEDYETVSTVMAQVCLMYGDITAIVQGGARGADMLGRRWAMENKIPYEQYDADWRRYGNSAGPIRNQEMLEESGATLVVAFPGGDGTYDMIKRAKQAGLEVVTVNSGMVK